MKTAKALGLEVPPTLLIARFTAIEQSPNSRRKLRLSNRLLKKVDTLIQPALMNDRIS